jgi:hypothetical protein
MAAGGPGVALPCTGSAIAGTSDCWFPLIRYSYQLELHYQRAPDRAFFGAALENGPQLHLVGVAAFMGARHGWRHLYVEGTVGAGLELQRLEVTTISRSELSAGTTLQPAMYARATGSIGIPINSALDVLAQVGIHFSAMGIETDFVNSAVGVRLKLP